MSAVWWIDTNKFGRKCKAHILTGKHLGYGNYATACGKSINVEDRQKVSATDWLGLNVHRCRICERSLVWKESEA